MLAPQQSMRLTPIGWVILLFSLGIGVTLRIVLPLWWPEQFAPTDRNDPRNQALAMPFILVPIIACTAAVVLQLLGYPVLRASARPDGQDSRLPPPPQASITDSQQLP